MSRWFPRADNKPGINKALVAGAAGALVVAGIDAYGDIVRVLRLQQFNADVIRGLEIMLLVNAIVWTAFALVTAWRFSIGKGLLWGSVLLLFFLLPLVGFFVMGKTAVNVGWIIIRFPVGAALMIGIWGAWGARRFKPAPNYGEVFE